MRKRAWIAAAAFVALAAAGALWAASSRPDAGARRPEIDCCLDPTCPPGCKPSCPPDCTDAAKTAQEKAKRVCPPCADCP